MPEPRSAGIGGGVAMPSARALPLLGPEPVSPVNPALAATRVRLATVAARYNWNRVLMRLRDAN